MSTSAVHSVIYEDRSALNTAAAALSVEGARAADPFLPKYFRWKGAVDRALAALLLLPGLPLIGVLVFLIRRTSPGPGIYRQRRVGKDGKPYTMYKLRSMRQDAEAGTGPVWTAAGNRDPRMTPLGYWLRKLHLDELPQLFNVLKGEMSLVGPRPERPEFVEVLADSIPGYLDRLAAPPGITGLAQINLPPDTSLDDVRRKLVLDREYIQTASLILDLRMLLCTLLRIVGVQGSLAMRVMRLERAVAICRCGEGDEDHLPTPDKVARQLFAAPSNGGSGELLNANSQRSDSSASVCDGSSLSTRRIHVAESSGDAASVLDGSFPCTPDANLIPRLVDRPR